jgi:chemotaxis protein methyltransferase CheR
MILPTEQKNETDKENIDDLKIPELIDFIYDCYGYDFRNYAKASLKRRVEYFLKSQNMNDVSQIKDKIASDRTFFFEFLSDLTISTTELFRDPPLYRALIKHVIPVLRTYAAFKLWHAGCSTGEEVYSMAILLHEHGLLQRATIYATDINRHALKQAKAGIVASRILKRDSHNYFESGLRRSLLDYWYTQHGYSLLDKSLLRNIVFSEHNLVTDAAFSEMQLILCRNVLIYFNRELQNHVLELFRDSLSRQGSLCLGMKESLSFSSVARDFIAVSRPERIFQKKTRMST